MEGKDKKIILAGGGTSGSVSPLLAIAADLRAQSSFAKATADKGGFEFLFIGTRQGIEKQMVKEAGLRYRSILAGKFRRYFSWQNLWDIAKIKLGFWQSLIILLREKPDLVMTAGSFVSVPVAWAAWLLGVPIIAHQMDVRPGLANRLIAPFAKIITVTFEKSLTDYGKKAIWTGNPTQLKIKNDKLKIKEDFNLKSIPSVIFIVGGGTGAEPINKLVEGALENLITFCQIIHSTGKGKMIAKRHENYHSFEFLNSERMSSALAIADVIVSRAGLNALAEIALAAKPAIVIPVPDSHQEDNAALLVEKNAAIVLNQHNLNSDTFVAAIKSLLDNPAKREELGRNINLLFKTGANEEIVTIIKKLLIK